MFKYKTQAELEALSAEELAQYHTEMKAHEKQQQKEEIEKATKPVSDEVKALKDAQSKADATIKDLSDQLAAMSEAMKKVEGEPNVEKMVDDFLAENIDAIKLAFKTGNGSFDVSKAVGTVLTTNGTLTTALPANFVVESTGVPRVALRRPLITNHVNTFNTSTKSLPYVEAVPGEGDFAVVAEGVSKPQLDLDWVTNYVTPSKFAGWIKVTDEAIEDIPRLRDMIINYLRDKHDIFKEKQVFTYLSTAATAYVAATGGLYQKVIMPNIMDVINAMQLQIINAPNYVDEPDFLGDTILMNVNDFFVYFGAAKDTLGRPLYADGFTPSSRVFTYNGYTFIASSLVTAGQIYLYDSTKIDVTNYIPYHVSIGWVNDDFIKNQFVILGESRGHIYIKNHDKRAFVKGTIATVMTDIEVPAVPAG